MKMTKRMIGILLACAMLMCAMPLAVSAAGTQDNPINANDKWFGYGVDCFLLNTTLEANDTDGVWYRLTADTAGILQLEHSAMATEETPAPDYRITAVVNGTEYVAYSNGIYYKPITTYPLAVGEVIDIHVIAQDTTQGGTIYLNAKFISGDGSTDINQMVKVKSAPAKLYVAAGATVYYQDDSLQADYATQYVELTGDSVADVTLYTAAANGVGTVGKQTAFNDTDGDNIIEGKLGGSLGSAGAPAVKPAWAITNNSGEDRCFILKVVSSAHECNWDNNADTDCNTCGAIREMEPLLSAADILDFGGNAVSEDKNGLAFKFSAKVKNIAIAADYTADYTNATVTIEGVEYKLIQMGAVMNNTKASESDLSAIDGMRVLNIAANKVLYNETDGFYFNIRITDIPDNHKDTVIVARPYYIYEDAEGQAVIVYDNEVSCAYNGVVG